MTDTIRTKTAASLFDRLMVTAVAFLVATLCLPQTFPQVAMAETSSAAGEKTPATLTVEATFGEGSSAKPIAGMEFSAYEVIRKSGSGGDELLEPFFSTSDTYDSDMTASQMKELAKRLAESTTKIEANAVGVTNDEGVAQLGQLEYGVYLVVQTDAKNDAASYTMSDPYLIDVPQLNGDGTVTYDVKAYPKFKEKPQTPETSTPEEQKNPEPKAPQAPKEVEEKPATVYTSTNPVETSTTVHSSRSPSPKTGDDSSIMASIGFVAAGLLTALAAMRFRHGC